MGTGLMYIYMDIDYSNFPPRLRNITHALNNHEICSYPIPEEVSLMLKHIK